MYIEFVCRHSCHLLLFPFSFQSFFVYFVSLAHSHSPLYWIELLNVHQHINYVCSKSLQKYFAAAVVVVVIVVVVVLVADIMFCNTQSHTFQSKMSQFMLCDRGKKTQLHSSRQFAILIRLDVSLSFFFSFSDKWEFSEAFCTCFYEKRPSVRVSM